MADNTTYQSSTPATPPAGFVCATDNIGGVDYQRVKLALGADGTASDAPVGAGTEAGVLRVTLPTDGTGKIATVTTLTGTTSLTPGTAAANLGKAEDAAHTSGDVGVMALSVRQDTAAALAGTDADYQPLITDASGRLHVTNSAGIGGTVAHDGADAGNPIKIGGKARTTNPTAVADADRVDATFDTIGRQIVVANQVRALQVRQATTITNSTSETTILTAGAAGVFHDVTFLKLSNATATAVSVTIKDATAGTTVDTIDLAANGGAIYPLAGSPLNQTTAANNWTATLSALSITVHILVVAVKNV